MFYLAKPPLLSCSKRLLTLATYGSPPIILFNYLLLGFFCEACNKSFIDSDNLWPDSTTFTHWLPTFLKDNPCQDCPKGGHAAYGQVRTKIKNESFILFLMLKIIITYVFRA